MKPLNKEDMPKLIVLIVLAVGIFGFALFQFVASSSPSVAAVPAAPAAASGTASTGTLVASAAGSGTVSASPDGAVEPELDFLHVGPPTGGKDPFIPNGSAAEKPVTVAVVPAARPLPSVVATDSKRSNVISIMQPFGSNQPTFQEREPKAASKEKPVETMPIELPAPAWSISGIVLAERDSDGIKRGRDVAILRDSAGNRRFVTVGDPVDNGYHVSAVLSGGVEIRNDKRTTMIHLNSSTSKPSEVAAGTATGTASLGINGATTRAN
ncbi:MAG: hypothetical protein V4671_15300 [Armatimonadota bacterium]